MSEHPIHELDDDVHQRVRLGREPEGQRQRTSVSITPEGRKALKRELAALRQIMAQVDDAEVGSESTERTRG